MSKIPCDTLLIENMFMNSDTSMYNQDIHCNKIQNLTLRCLNNIWKLFWYNHIKCHTFMDIVKNTEMLFHLYTILGNNNTEHWEY